MENLKIGSLVNVIHCCPHGFRDGEVLDCMKCNPEGLKTEVSLERKIEKLEKELQLLKDVSKF